MADKVLHVKSRCGGGKSRHTIEEMHKFLVASSDETIIFASKTNKLTAQNHQDFEKAAKTAGVQPSSLVYKRIDIDTVPSSSNVVEHLHETLDSGFRGVLFVSHEVLTTVDPAKIQHVRLITDEVPSVLVEHLHVRYEAKDFGNTWEKYLATEPSQHKSYWRVIIAPDVDNNEVLRLVKNIRAGIDNSISKGVAELLEFILDGHEVTYCTTTNGATKNKVLNVYQGIDWRSLDNITDNVKRFGVLSAQLRDTLVGYVLENVLQKNIEETNINDDISLETHHKNKARIFPVLSSGSWSTTLKERPANEALSFKGQSVSSDEKVIAYVQTVAKDIIKDEKSLLILNQKNDVHPALDTPDIDIITSASHGSNSYNNIDHAIYLSSNRPNPFEEKSLRMFAEDHGLKNDSIIDAVLRERCYETCYQCLARTSIRNPEIKENEHLFVVPDMHYAEYVKSWFDGSAVIDDSYSHSIVRNKNLLSEDERFNKIVQIRGDYLAGKGKLKDLLKKYNLKEKTYKRHVEKFRPELENLGLIKPKRQDETPKKYSV